MTRVSLSSDIVQKHVTQYWCNHRLTLTVLSSRPLALLEPALHVCESFLKSTPTVQTIGPRAFIYVSAEDCNRPVVPSGDIETKREAEILIEKMIEGHPEYRSVYIRPCASPLTMPKRVLSSPDPGSPHLPSSLPPRSLSPCCASRPFRNDPR